jgi:hypothetical protein
MAAVSSSGRVRSCRRLVRAACGVQGRRGSGVRRGAALCSVPSRSWAFRVVEQEPRLSP